MKGLMKDAIDTKEGEKKEGGAPAGLDVSKMPFSADSIKQVVAHYQPQIQGCYEETMATKDKAVEGKLKTSWLITPDGLVKRAKIDKKGTTLKDSKLHDCVVTVLSAMTFPKPPDRKEHPIEYPFNLKAIK
ncbi:MAG: AgmX/PglI C-terminal domain-containing protein [Myxococcaceae bacterium]|nr:AgmX/PglI C-terminal domain-containing protein [Myxococcaceae bacterium]